MGLGFRGDGDEYGEDRFPHQVGYHGHVHGYGARIARYREGVASLPGSK